MRTALALGAAALLAACATTTARSPAADSSAATAAWLVGTWVLLQPGVDFPEDCGSGLPITYLPDGTYAMTEEQGRWRLRGDRIEETATAVEGEDNHVGVTIRNGIRRAGPDEMVKTFEDGSTGTLRRCPPTG